jgi:hypothetical protein
MPLSSSDHPIAPLTFAMAYNRAANLVILLHQTCYGEHPSDFLYCNKLGQAMVLDCNYSESVVVLINRLIPSVFRRSLTKAVTLV